MRLRSWLLITLLSAPAQAQERLTLDEAVRRALIRNSSAEVARQEILRAEGVLEEVRAPALPTLYANGAYTRLDKDRRLNGNVISARNQTSGNVQLTVPLIAPGRWVAWAHAGDQAEVARLSAVDVGRGVAVATARAYLGVMAQHRLVQIDTQARDDSTRCAPARSWPPTRRTSPPRR